MYETTIDWPPHRCMFREFHFPSLIVVHKLTEDCKQLWILKLSREKNSMSKCKHHHPFPAEKGKGKEKKDDRHILKPVSERWLAIDWHKFLAPDQDRPLEYFHLESELLLPPTEAHVTSAKEQLWTKSVDKRCVLPVFSPYISE